MKDIQKLRKFLSITMTIMMLLSCFEPFAGTYSSAAYGEAQAVSEAAATSEVQDLDQNHDGPASDDAKSDAEETNKGESKTAEEAAGKDDTKDSVSPASESRSDKTNNSQAAAKAETDSSKAAAKAEKKKKTDKSDKKEVKLRYRELDVSVSEDAYTELQKTGKDAGKELPTTSFSYMSRFWMSLTGEEAALPAKEEIDQRARKDVPVKVTVKALVPEGVKAEVDYIEPSDEEENREESGEKNLFGIEITLVDKAGNVYVPAANEPVEVTIRGGELKKELKAKDPVVIYAYAENEDRNEEYTEKYKKALEQEGKDEFYSADVLVYESEGFDRARRMYEQYDKKKSYKNGDDAVRFVVDENGLSTKDDTVTFTYDYAVLAKASASKKDPGEESTMKLVVAAQQPESTGNEQKEQTEQKSEQQEQVEQKPAEEKGESDIDTSKEDADKKDEEKENKSDEKVAVKGKILTAGDGKKYEVTVSYGKSAGIPEDAELQVTDVSKNFGEYSAYLSETAKKLGQEADSFDFVHALDIKLIDPKTGEEYQPEKNIQVSIRLLKEELKEVQEISVLHFEDSENESGEDSSDIIGAPFGLNPMDEKNSEVLSSRVEGDSVQFTTDGFSVFVVAGYTVDFHWGDYTYNLEGGSTIFLSELLEILQKGHEKSGLDAENDEKDENAENGENEGSVVPSVEEPGEDGTSLPNGSAGVYDTTKEEAERLAEIIADMSQIESVSFSNPELLSIEKKSSKQAENDWLLKSHAAFDTEEMLSIKFTDRSELKIRVTDASGAPTGDYKFAVRRINNAQTDYGDWNTLEEAVQKINITNENCYLYIGTDYTLNTEIAFDSNNKNVTIIGNGHTITRGSGAAGDLITFSRNGTFTIKDLTIDGNNNTSAVGSLIKTNHNYAVLTLENTTVTGHTVNAADICAVDALTNRTASEPLVNVSGTTSITGNTANGVPANLSVTGTDRLTISADLSGEIGITTPQNAVGNQFAVKAAAVTEIGTLTCDTNSAFLPKLDGNKIIWESLANIRQMFGNPDTTIDDLKTYPDEDDLVRIPQGAVAGGENDTNPHMLWKSVKHNNNNSIDITLNFFKKQQDIKLDFIFVIDETGTMTNNASGNGYTTSQAKWARYAAAVASEGIFDLNDRYQTNGADSRICYISYSGHGASTQIYKSGWLTDTNSALLWANKTKVGGGDTYHDIVVEDILSMAAESKDAGHIPVLVWMCDYTARYGEGHAGCVESSNMARIKAAIPDRYAMLIYETYTDTMKARMGYLTDYQFYMPNKSDPSTLVTPILQIVRDAVARCGDKLAIEDGLNSGVADSADTNGITSTGEGSVAASYDSGTDTARWTLINSGEDDNRLHAGRMYTKVIHIPMTDDVYSGQMPTNTDVKLKDGSTVLNSIPASQSPIIKSDVTLILKGKNTSGSPLEGAKFTLNRGSNTWNLTTDSDGKIVLPWGESDKVGATTAKSTFAFDKGSSYTLTQLTTASGYVRPAGSWTLTVGNDYKITATTNASPANTNRTRDMAAKAGKFEIYNDAAPKIIYHYNQPVGTKTDVEEPVSFAVDATVRTHTLGGVYNTQVEGYTFTGWATAANASKASYHEGEEITVYAKGSGTEPDPVELYGVWVQEGELVPLTIEKKWDENIDWTKEPYASQKAANPTVNFVVYGCTAADSTTGTQITAYTDDTGTTQVTGISESDSAGMISNWARTVYVPKSVTEGGAKKTFTSYRIEEINLQVAGGKGTWDTPAEDYQSSSDNFVTVTTDKLPEGVKIYAPRNVDSVNLDLDLSTNHVVNNITSVTIEYGVNNNQYIFRTKAKFDNTKTLGPGSSINPKYEHIYQLKLLTNAEGYKPVFRKLYINDVEYPVGPGNWISRAVITTGGNVTTRPEDLDVSASTTTVSYLVKESQDRKLTVTNSFSLPVEEKVPVIVNKVWDDRITWTDSYFENWKDLNEEIPLTVDGEDQTLKTDDSVATSELARNGQSSYTDATEHNAARQSFSKLFYVENGFDVSKLQEGTLEKADNKYVWTNVIEETAFGKWIPLEGSEQTQTGYVHLHSNRWNGDNYHDINEIIFEYNDGVNTDITYRSVAYLDNANLEENGKDYYVEVLLPSNADINNLRLIYPGENGKWYDYENNEFRSPIQVCYTAGTVERLPKYVQGRAKTDSDGKDIRYDNVSFTKSVPAGGTKYASTSKTLKVYLPTQYTITNSLSICKIVDTSGTTQGTEHCFPTLNAAVTYARAHGNGAAMSATNPVKIEMLVDYVIPQNDKVTLDKTTDNIIITTAATSSGMYKFTPTFAEGTDAGDRLSTDSKKTAILKRGSDVGNYSLFTVSNSNASLRTENIIFDGANISTNVRGTIISTKGPLTIAGGTTMRNVKTTESYYGGAVDAYESVTMESEKDETILFENCTGAKEGGAIETNKNTLTINNKGKIRANDCNAYYGGWICTDTGGSFIINNSGTIEVKNCNATSNDGGAIFTGTFKAEDNSGSISFTNCTAASKGGAIIANRSAASSDTFVLTNTSTGTASFTNCSAKYGGAVYVNSGTCTITGADVGHPVTFEGCTASNNGGAIYQEGGNALTLTKVTFGKSGNATSGCSAASTGGAIYTAAAGTLTDCSFYYCKTTSSTSGGGGAIYYYNGIQQLNGCVFDHCEAAGGSQSQGIGGAIKYENGGKLVIDRSAARRSAFTNCKAKRFGGAIGFELDSGLLEVKNTDFTSCVAANQTGGAIGSDAATLKIDNSTFNDCKAENGNGGAICAGMDSVTPNVQMENSVVTGCVAKSGAAIYSKGNLTIRQTGTGTSEIKNCSASGNNKGAVNLDNSYDDKPKMFFEGNVVISGNTNTANDTGNEHNVILDKNNNTTIYTTGTGIGPNADIGVYVTGTNENPYNSHGKEGMPFGTWGAEVAADGSISKTMQDTGDANLFRFTNDRNNSWGVKRGTDGLIYWNDPIVKVTDKDNVLLYELKVDNDGTENDVYLPAVYETLNGGLTAARGMLYTLNGTTYTAATAMSINNLRRMKMLKDYVIPGDSSKPIGLLNDKVTLDQTNDNIVITTAETTAPTAADTYIFNPTFTTAQGRLSTDSPSTAILKRGDFTNASLFDATNASAKIAFRNITLDGDNKTVTVPGGLVNSAGTVEVQSGTTMRNTKSSGSSNPSEAYGGGGAIWARDVAINDNTGDILFDNCFAIYSGGAIYYSHHFDMNNNSGSITFKNCYMNGAAKGDGGAISNWESGSDHVFTATNNRGSIEFINCRAENNQTQGGAIFQHHGGNITLASTGNGRIWFSGCYAGAGGDTYCGGAISAWDSNVTISLTGTATSPIVFENCHAETGNGGAIYTPGNVVLTNVRFGGYKTDPNGNYVDSDGNTLSSGEKPVVDSDLACRAAGSGGAVYAGGSVTYTSTAGATYTGCYGSYGSSGGAIYAGSAVNTNENGGTLNFENCHSSGTGGAIYAGSTVNTNENGGTLNFENCYSSGTGGAIYAGSTVNINENGGTLNFENCYSSGTGGAIYATTSVSLNDNSGTLNFDGCYTTGSGAHGGAIRADGGVTMNNNSGNIKFKDCHSGTKKEGDADGGAIAVYARGKTFSATANTGTISFENCTTSEGQRRQGGAIILLGGTLTMTSTGSGSISFKDCYADADSDKLAGGAISVWDGASTITLTGTVEHPIIFEGCHTNGAGGAIVNNNSSEMNLTCVSFDDCYAAGTNGKGGAVYTNGSLNMTNVNINGHSGGADGLAAGTANANLGGAVYSGGNLTIKQSGSGTSEIKNCSASAANGGAVQVANDKTMTFEGNVVIEKNTNTSSDTAHEHNVVLDVDNNAVIKTSDNGLGTNAHIGVYVIDGTDKFDKHGQYEQDFGTHGTSTENLSAFTNDRNGYYGEACPVSGHEKLIRWTGYLCKLTNESGNLLYTTVRSGKFGGKNITVGGTEKTVYPAVYKFLKTQTGTNDPVGGFTDAQSDHLYTVSGTTGTAVAANAPVQVQMLRNYTQPSTDQPTISGNRAVTFTTANKTAAENPGTGDIYIYNRGNDTTNTEADRATITRGANGRSMFTATGDTTDLTTKNLIFNGGSGLSTPLTAGNYDGGIINFAGRLLTIDEKTIMKSSTARNGGAIYSTNGVTVSGGNTTESWVQFWDCDATTNGGAIYTAGDIDSTQISISNADFEDCYTNKTNGQGGAMYFTNGTQNLTDVEVDGVADDHKNSQGIDANQGGGIYLKNGNLTLTHVVLHDCHVSGSGSAGGGIYMADGTLTVNGNTNGGSEFKECAAPYGNGGAIYNASNNTTSGDTVSIVNTTFDGHFMHPNNVTGPSSSEEPDPTTVDPGSDGEFGEGDSSGGDSSGDDDPALPTHDIIATDTHLEDDVCNAKNGGAIYMAAGTLSLGGSGDTDAVSIKNCTVTTNGGAIYNASNSNYENATVKLQNVTIDGHDQSRAGGSLPTGFVNAQNGGAIYLANGTLSITGGAIQNVRVHTNGGAIYNGSASKMTADGTNKATVLINGTEFTGRTVLNDDTKNHANAANGGAIYNYIGNLRVVNNAKFNDFRASQDGGVIYDRNKPTGNTATDIDTVNLQNVTIDGHAGGVPDSEANAQRGGAIFTESHGQLSSGGSIRLSGCTIYDCVASSQGGAIYNQSTRREPKLNDEAKDEPTVHLLNTTIDGHKSLDNSKVNADRGGAIMLANGTLEMEGSIIRNCKTNTDGGALTSYGGGTQFKDQNGQFGVNDYTIKLKNTTIEKCSSNNGGGISVKQILTLLNSTIKDCAATGNGGAIYLFGDNTNKRDVRMNDSTYNQNGISGNTAGGHGGGIYVPENSKVSIAGSPNFGGTDSTGGNRIGTGTNSKREDIYIAGYLGLNGTDPKLAESLIVTDKLYEKLTTVDAVKGQIWVGAQQQDNEDNNHWDTLKQFAKFDSSLMTKDSNGNTIIDSSKLNGTDVEKIYAAFRNAKLTDYYGMTGDGQTGGIQCIYWEGVQGSRKVILRKVSTTYDSLKNAKFTITKGSKQIEGTDIHGNDVTEFESGSSGVFYIGMMDYGVYVLKETNVPNGYDESKPYYYLVVDEDGALMSDPSKEGQAFATDAAAKTAGDAKFKERQTARKNTA